MRIVDDWMTAPGSTIVLTLGAMWGEGIRTGPVSLPQAQKAPGDVGCVLCVKRNLLDRSGDYNARIERNAERILQS